MNDADTNQVSEVASPAPRPPVAVAPSVNGPPLIEAAGGSEQQPVMNSPVESAGAPVPPASTDGTAIPAPMEAAVSEQPAPPPIEVPVSAPKPAQWKILEPDCPWLPPELEPHAPELTALKQTHHAEGSGKACGGWHYAGATRRGRMHEHAGTWREDAVFMDFGSDWAVLAVSDGAGTHKFSRIGSELVCRTLVTRMSEKLRENAGFFSSIPQKDLVNNIAGDLAQAVHAGVTRLHTLAEAGGCSYKDFRCTLLAAVYFRSDVAGEVLLPCQVGDGFIAVLGDDGTAQRLGKSDSGQFSGEVATFIPDPDAVEKATASCKAMWDELSKAGFFGGPRLGITALVLASDGVEDPFFPVEKNAGIIFDQLSHGASHPAASFTHQTLHEPVLGCPDDAERLAHWLAFEKRGENDDRSILIFHRAPYSPPPKRSEPAST